MTIRPASSAWIAASAIALLAACASQPPTVEPPAALALADEMLQKGRAADAVELLEAYPDAAFVGVDAERYQLLLATAYAGDGDLWSAFEVIKDFEQQHPFSELQGRVQDLEFEIGEQLIESPWHFLFFASDADDGQAVLEHFVLRYPRHPRADDALRLLGDKAFEEGNWELAQTRYSDIVLSHPESEWSTLARFRVAMASFERLEGPPYDLRSMRRAQNELQQFLELPVENRQFVAEAKAALATVREWLAEKHLRIADFYRVIDNQPGERLHLAEAAGDYPDTAAGKDAQERLQELGPPAAKEGGQ